jgi:hypothetical protein
MSVDLKLLPAVYPVAVEEVSRNQEGLDIHDVDERLKRVKPLVKRPRVEVGDHRETERVGLTPYRSGVVSLGLETLQSGSKVVYLLLSFLRDVLL